MWTNIVKQQTYVLSEMSKLYNTNVASPQGYKGFTPSGVGEISSHLSTLENSLQPLQDQ